MTGSSIRFAAEGTDITPGRSVPLAGFRARTAAYETVADRLEANAVLLTDGGTRLVLLGVDVLYVGPRIRAELLERLRGVVLPGELLLCASHTHFAPATDPTKPLLGRVDDAYVEELLGRLETLVRRTLAVQRAATVRYAEGFADHSINRRLLRKFTVDRSGLRFNAMLSAPNPLGPRDERVRVMTIHGPSHEVLAVIWNYACHPVGYPERLMVSADFPGVVRAALRQRYGLRIPVVFLQGFSGDTRPGNSDPRRGLVDRLKAVMRGPRFHGFTADEWRCWATGLATAVLRAVGDATSDGQALPGLVSTGRIEVPIQRFVSDAAPDRSVSFQVANLGDCVILVAISAEPVVDYVRSVQALFPAYRVVPVGYVDDVFGYLPTREMLAQGGYEVDGFLESLSLRGPLQSDVEAECLRALQGLAAAGRPRPGPAEVARGESR